MIFDKHCNHCGIPLDARGQKWWQGVPGLGDACEPCHLIWRETKCECGAEKPRRQIQCDTCDEGEDLDKSEPCE